MPQDQVRTRETDDMCVRFRNLLASAREALEDRDEAVIDRDFAIAEAIKSERLHESWERAAVRWKHIAIVLSIFMAVWTLCIYYLAVKH